MSRCVITPRAERSLGTIWRHIAKDSITYADRQIERLQSIAHLIADNPEMGTARSNLATGARGFPVDRTYLIVYRVIDDGIEVLRFVHGARNLKKIGF